MIHKEGINKRGKYFYSIREILSSIRDEMNYFWYDLQMKKL